MILYKKLRELENSVNSKNPLPLNALARQNRIIIGVENGQIVYIHGANNKDKSYFDIDLLYKTYFIFETMGELSVNNIRKIDANYTKNKRPCNAVTFMLLMNYFFDKQIFGSGKKGDPYIVKW